jgi:hypothetical protein
VREAATSALEKASFAAFRSRDTMLAIGDRGGGV